jgi:hypothetical protein
MSQTGHEAVDVEIINLTSQGGCMDRQIRMIEERLSRLERFEKARYHRRMKILDGVSYMIWLIIGLGLLLSGTVLAAGIKSLMS